MKNASNSATPRKLIGRASIAAAGTVYQQGISLVSGLIIARVIGAADFGVINLARNLVDITGIMTRLGLDIGLQRHFGESLADGGRRSRNLQLRRVRLVADSLAVVPILLIALGVGGYLEENIYQYSGFGKVLLCLALSLPFLTDMAVLGGAYRGVLKLAPAVLAESIIVPTVRLAIIAILFVYGWRLWAVVVGTVLGSWLASVFLAVRAKRDFGDIHRITCQPWSDSLRVIGYSSVLAVSVLVGTLTRSMDVLLLGHFATAAILGQFALLKTLLLVMGVLGTAFGQGLGALIAERHARRDRAAMAQVMSQVARWITLGTFPLFAIFLFWGAELTLLFGASFNLPQSTVSWLAAGQFVFVVLGPCGWALSMTGNHFSELMILMAGLIISTVLCWLAIPAFGQFGAAVATCVSIGISNALRVLMVRRFLGTFPFNTDVLRIIAAGLVIALICDAAVRLLAMPPIWHAMAGIGVFVLFYLILAWIGLLRPPEKAAIREMARSARCAAVGAASRRLARRDNMRRTDHADGGNPGGPVSPRRLR